MVSSLSAATIAAENDRRKRQTLQTMEKSKVNHLTRQLQMRLQYARLKVEHGWAKQNLNEVENLYFHNSSLRGPKPYVPSPIPAVITTQAPDGPMPQGSNSQSSLSYKIGTLNSVSVPSSSSQSVGDGVGENNISQEDSTVNQTWQLEMVPTPSIPTPANESTPIPELMMVDSSMVVDPPVASTSTLVQTSQMLETGVNPVLTPTTSNVGLTSSNSPPRTQSPTANTPSSSSHYLTVKPPRSRTNKHPAGPKGAHQNLTAKELVDFSSTSTLTYDSFWSSHTGSTTASRPSRPAASTTAIAELSSAFQNASPFAASLPIPELYRLANPLSSSTASSTMPTNIEQARDLGGLTQ